MSTVTMTRIGDVAKDKPVNADAVAKCLNDIVGQVNGGLNSENIATGGIPTACLADKSVTAAKIADYTITASQISLTADIAATQLALASGKIILGDASGDAQAVTPTGDITIDKDGVTTIGEGKVGTDELADESVTTEKIGLKAVANEQLDDLAVSTGKIQDSQITLAKMAANSVDAGKIVDGSITNAELSADAAIAPSKMAFTGSVGFKSATDAYWQVTTKDSWVQCALEDKLSCAATGQDVIVFIQFILLATGPNGCVVQMSLKPNDGGSWNPDNVSCPTIITTIANGRAASSGTVPVRAPWDGTTSKHWFWYQLRDSADITGGMAYLSAQGWISYKPI